MNMSLRRCRAILRKELRDYRRSGQMIASMAIFPLIFLIQPLIFVFASSTSTALALRQAPLLLYLLAIPALTPCMLAAYSVTGERQQATLEPVLTTPIRNDELLLGKALAALLPSVVVSYAVYAFFIVCVELFARPGIASALIQGPELLAQLLFTPLLAALSIWIGVAISTWANDVRTAQSLGVGATIPLAIVTSLIAVKIIPVTPFLAIGLGGALLVVDGLGWRLLAARFDRERLITGTK